MSESSNTEIDVKQAVHDLEVIKRVLARAPNGRMNEASVGVAQRAHFTIQLVGAILASLLIALEVLSGHLVTQMILVSAEIEQLRIVGVVETGAWLILLSVIFYYIVFKSALRQGQSRQRYVERNFAYLKNFSIFADLAVKYAIFSLIILAQCPELVASLFAVCIADYLFQGRFFILPIGFSMLGGSICLLVAFWCWLGSQYFLVYPAFLFLMAAVSSCFYIRRLPQILESARTLEGSQT